MAAAGHRRNHLRFEGGRFEQRGLPISVLQELQVYCELVVKAAKAVYFRDNPYSRRVPNGFKGRFCPRLIDISDGSVTPILEREYTDGEVLDDEFDIAAHHLGDVVAAVHQDTVLSESLELPQFDISEITKLGKTLEVSEKIILRSSSGKEAIFDTEVRRSLEHYRDQINATRARIVGRVIGVDAAGGRFTIWSDESRRNCRGPFHSPSDLPLLKRVMTDDPYLGPSVELEGIVLFDASQHPSGWKELYSIRERLFDSGSPFEKLHVQLANLGSLRDRWLDDDSRAPTSDAIVMAVDISYILESRSIPAPTAFPTPDGGVSLEWITKDVQIGVTILASGTEGELSFWNQNTEVDSFEQYQNLDANQVVQFVSKLIRD